MRGNSKKQQRKKRIKRQIPRYRETQAGEQRDMSMAGVPPTIVDQEPDPYGDYLLELRAMGRICFVCNETADIGACDACGKWVCGLHFAYTDVVVQGEPDMAILCDLCLRVYRQRGWLACDKCLKPERECLCTPADLQGGFDGCFTCSGRYGVLSPLSIQDIVQFDTEEQPKGGYLQLINDMGNTVGIHLLHGRDPLTGNLCEDSQRLVDLFSSCTMLGPLGHDIIIHVRGVLPGSDRLSLHHQLEFFDQDDLYMRSQDHLGACPGIQEMLDALYRLCFEQISPPQPLTTQERAQRLCEQARTCFMQLPHATAVAKAEGRQPAFFTAAPEARRADFEVALGRALREIDAEMSESLLESPLEKRFWKTWHRLFPESTFTLVAQYPINQYRVDFAEIATKTVVEIDGAETHSGVEAITRDRQRERAIEQAGWYVVRFGGREVYRDTERCVRELATILSQRQK